MKYLKALALLFISLFLATPCSASDGYATYYTVKSCQKEGNSGAYTASGEIYNESALTCAMPHRPFGKLYKVTSMTTGRSVTVRHNDLGPGKGPRTRGVVIDLTPAAFVALGHDLADGKISVKVVQK